MRRATSNIVPVLLGGRFMSSRAVPFDQSGEILLAVRSLQADMRDMRAGMKALEENLKAEMDATFNRGWFRSNEPLVYASLVFGFAATAYGNHSSE